MNLSSVGIIGLLGTAGMIQDPARVRLLGPLCSKLESTAVRFDESGKLTIDLSSLPPLNAGHRKTVCQIKVPYHEGSTMMAGSWRMDLQSKGLSGSKILGTVRFSGVGTVGEARIWEPDASADEQSWQENYAITDDGRDEDELKITWTLELQLPAPDASNPQAPSPSVQWKEIVLAPPPPVPAAR